MYTLHTGGVLYTDFVLAVFCRRERDKVEDKVGAVKKWDEFFASLTLWHLKSTHGVVQNNGSEGASLSQHVISHCWGRGGGGGGGGQMQKEGMKTARSYKQQSKATQHTRGSHFSKTKKTTSGWIWIHNTPHSRQGALPAELPMQQLYCTYMYMLASFFLPSHLSLKHVYTVPRVHNPVGMNSRYTVPIMMVTPAQPTFFWAPA